MGNDGEDVSGNLVFFSSIFRSEKESTDAMCIEFNLGLSFKRLIGSTAVSIERGSLYF